jgi:hypothetical protein
MDEDKEQGYWRCPLCAAKNGEHAVDCWIIDDTQLEWVDLRPMRGE